jgi:error-prone DNA polymerase
MIPAHAGEQAATYVELQVTTHFSFLRGASSPEELFAAAALLGLPALGIVDRNSVAGIVRAWDAEKDDGRARDRRLPARSRRRHRAAGLSDRSRGLWPAVPAAVVGKARAGKGACHLDWNDVEEWNDGLIGMLVPDRADADASGACAHRPHLRRPVLSRACRCGGVRATRSGCATSPRWPPPHGWRRSRPGDVLYHSPDRRLLQDVVTCIREKCTIDELGERREARRRPPPQDRRGDGAAVPTLPRDTRPVARSLEMAARCTFSLDQLRYQYPDEIRDAGPHPAAGARAADLGEGAGALSRWRHGKVRAQLEHELRLIGAARLRALFPDRPFDRRLRAFRDILCQGRGSAANSAVCYVLGVTSIDPVRSELLFERFVSAERREPPDIDVDFEHERREEVIQWIYETYGRTRSALTAVVTRYRARGAVREVGKALGLSEDMTAGLSSQVWGFSREGVEEKHAEELNLDMGDRRLALTLELARLLINTPRHLSQHPGGFVLTRDRLDELVPIEPAAMDDRQVIEWDKDDIDALGFMKVDVLALGMLSCMRRAFEFLETDKGLKVDLATIPAEDPATYAMIRKADTLGVFQIESRAQMACCPGSSPGPSTTW